MLIICISCLNQTTVSANGTISSSSDPKKMNNDSKGILVRFKPGTDESTIKDIQKKAELTTVRTLSIPDLYLMKITDERSVEAVIKDLKNYDVVHYSRTVRIACNNRLDRVSLTQIP